MLTTTRTIHEFLARFNDAGVLQGAHVAYLETKAVDGEVVSSKILDPQPVALTDAAKLAEIGAAINASTLAEIDAKAAQIVALTGEKTAADQAKAQAESARDAALAQLLEYQTPVDANGVPKSVTMRQAQLALLGAGLLDTVEAAIAAMPGDAGRAAQITWAKSSAVERTNPLIVAMAGILSLTDAQIDALFIAASKL